MIWCTRGGGEGGAGTLTVCHSVDIQPGQMVSISALAEVLGSAENVSFYETESSLQAHGTSLHLFTKQHDSKGQTREADLVLGPGSVTDKLGDFGQVT